MTKAKILSLLVVSLILSACNNPISIGKKEVKFSDDDQVVETITPYVDKFASATINITQTKNLNQEFEIKFKTYNPQGEGTATFKAKSIKEITAAGQKTPEEGKKLLLVDIAVRGNTKNTGTPSNFNQVGEHPSPQFVLIDKKNNITSVEETYYSDGYTEAKKLFELTKITLDSDQWVNTAIVFQIDQDITPDLAFRFVNLNGDTEFYDIAQ